MKLTHSTLTLAAWATTTLHPSSAVAAPPNPASCYATWGLEGFAHTNPLGPTTGGASGPTVTVTTAAALQSAVAGTEPRVVVVQGRIELPSRLKVGSNKSVVGHADASAHITGAGLDVYNGDNVVLQNLKISFILDNDSITIRNSTRVWVDHNEFESDLDGGPDKYDGQIDIIRASDWITVSWNYLHDHWKSSLVGNDATFRDLDSGHLHVTYHHNHWRNSGTRGPAGRFGHQHVYNNLYEDYRYQAIHSRSDNQVLVEGNVFRGDLTGEALSTYGLVIPMDSPNTCECGDEELDGFANLGAANDWGKGTVNITQVGNFTKAPYDYKLTPLELVEKVVKSGAGIGKI
ncbi:hypothetical protein MCOR25_006306 [Pyricularia grisea]|uniref:Pectate lyase domain-containing protein n=1 Tax=Pyricularia grisea TaxID=148305 RepID=A0A6P8BIZ0_PYRGI|nr:uncharacterized protein PgNI_01998 [Pyricularia grisea]KAI6362071.1 hypothetical protein MCOR25_006306 [Pyricularia grisea]TLD16861.1 hypothetical protein PgNI_01998 [Pyricularia grisea]